MNSQSQSEDDRGYLRQKDEDQEQDLLNNGHNNTKQYRQTAGKNILIINTVIIYTLLVAISLSLLYFNYAIYQKYSRHQTEMEGLLNSTTYSIKQTKTQTISGINSFVKEYSQKYQSLNAQFQKSTASIQLIKSQNEHKLDMLNLLSYNNTETLHFLGQQAESHHKYAGQIQKYFLSDLQTRTMKNSYFNSHRQKVSYTNIQSIVWVFSQSYPTDKEYLKKMYLHNVKYYCFISNFNVKIITPNNYFYYLSPGMIDKVAAILAKLEQRLTSHDRTNLGDHFETIKRVIFMFSILYENGGVILIDNVAFTQPLSWIHDMQILRKFNHKSHQVPPQVIGFFNPYYSSSKIKVESQSYKEIYQFPDVQRFFIAAIKRSRLIGEMFDQMISILQDPSALKDRIADEGYQMGLLKASDPYYQFFYISSHLVLQRKQKELDAGSNKLLAIDYYGLYLLNSGLGPTKLKAFLYRQSNPYKQNNVMDITRTQLEYKIGRIHYLHIFSDYWWANNLMLDIKNKKRMMLKGCLINQLFYIAGTDEGLVYDRIEEYQGKNRFKPWSKLPKKVWVFDTTDSKNLVGKMLIDIQTKTGKQQGIEVHSFDSKSIESLLTQQMVQQVNDIFAKSSYSDHPYLKQYILTLCLLSKQGGIYLDSSYFLLQGMEWVYNINQINESMVANKVGEFPEMFMFHNYHLRSSFNYTFDPALHTRVDPHLIYEQSFLAVAKDSPLIDQWVEDILKTLPMTTKQLDDKFNSCGLKDEVQYKYLIEYLPMDILRCLYAKGLSKITKQDYSKESNYYRIWSVDGDYGIYKINNNTNYDSVELSKNIYTALQSQEEVEDKIGPIFKAIKLDGPNFGYLNELYILQGDKQSKSIHSNSIMSKYFIQKIS